MSENQQFILTTEKLAQAYGTSNKTLLRNFQRHKEDFIEGKDYFVLEGEELKKFNDDDKLSPSMNDDDNLSPSMNDDDKLSPSIDGYISDDGNISDNGSKGGARVKYLWSQTGAFMFACFLNTSQARKAYKGMIEVAEKPQAAGISPEEHAKLKSKYKDMVDLFVEQVTVPHLADSDLDDCQLGDVEIVLDQARAMCRQLRAEHKGEKEVKVMLTNLEKKFDRLEMMVAHTQKKLEETDPQFIDQAAFKTKVSSDLHLLLTPASAVPLIESPKEVKQV